MTARERHRAAVVERDGLVCVFAGELVSGAVACRGPLQADHILRSSVIERRRDELLRWVARGLEVNPGQRRLIDADADELIADARNGWICCELHHGVKDRKLMRVAAERIPERFWRFVEQYDLGALAQREGLLRP